MNKPIRSELTAEQERLADRLKQAWLRHKDALELTQVKAAAALGMNQGSFTQYLNKHIAVNDKFTLDLCRLLKINPSEVDPRFSDLLYTETCRIPILYEWGRTLPLSQPQTAKDFLTLDRTIFGVKLTKSAPLKHGIVLCVERHSATSLGWLTHDKWSLLWRDRSPAPTGRRFWDIVGVLAGK